MEAEEEAAGSAGQGAEVEELAPLITDEAELRRLVQDEAMRLPDMDIAVSGIAGRFPKSDSVNEFEQNLRAGVDMVNDQDDSRFSCGLWGLPPRAGRLKDLSRFDAEFFGLELDEANYVDFQLRILYEVVYESILDAGVNPAALRGSRTGVFFGLHCNEFENAMADDPRFRSNGYYAQFGVKVAQYFDLRGINVTFDAACASSFVGLHNAAQAIADGLVDRALVCSANVPIHPTGSFIFLQMQMLSPTGYSRFLDSRADGYVKAEACVSVLLERKQLARRNYCSLLATMTSVDGYKAEGITFPSDKSQEDLIRRAKQLAGLSTNHVEYFEAHGTGTPAGDPQEARAVANVYFPPEDADQSEARKIGPLLVGSVKTNMGHSEAASGLCALTKVALMLEHELIYAGLHYEQPNANIESLKQGKLKFVDRLSPLRAKIVPLSCYGFGGSNVHAIVRANERPAIRDHEQFEDRSPRLVVMFGRSESAVGAFFDRLLAADDPNTSKCLSDDCLALVNALSEDKIDRLMNHRGYLIVNRAERKELSRSIALCQLDAIEEDAVVDAGRRVHMQESKARDVNLVLPGVGSQWPGMGAGLEDFAPFWSTIEHLAAILKPHGIDLVELLTNEERVESLSLAETFVSIVAYQVALIDILKNQLRVNGLGKIVGHSLGEVSCAYAAGLISSGESILVAYQMGKTLDDKLAKVAGRMIAIGAERSELECYLSSEHLRSKFPTVEICCSNGPTSTTISGAAHEVDGLREEISKSRHGNEWLIHEIDIAAALHNKSIMTQEIRRTLTREISKILMHKYDGQTGPESAPKTRWLPSFKTQATLASPEYFADCLCERVNFVGVIEQLEDKSIALEVGPSGIFESQIRQLKNVDLHYVKTMRRGVPSADKQVKLLEFVGQLYQAGATFSLNNFYHSGNSQQTIFPVRRKTPSLSSIFKWDHGSSLFVPRYPIQFSKSSAKCEMPFDMVQDRDKYLLGHCVEGRVLFPATGYLYLIWRVFSFTKRRIFDACFHDVENELVPIEFCNVRLLRAVILGGRAAQIYVHLEEATGKFEIKEGGSVVVEGYVRTPAEKPNSLLYDHVRDKIRDEDLQFELTADDIYKQFRVSGYDYGETFRNIEQSSYDGRFCRVKHNGHFVALTDSILQSIFLAISQYAPSGGLFLPTRFEYVRFQPEIILSKMRAAKVVFDLSDGSLNTKAKREIMTKIMQREAAVAKGEPIAEDEAKEPGEQQAESAEPKPECLFDVYCDPITGVIITDGIEMRGIKATPAPRRSDNNEVLMESYQFVRDIEDPIEDERLTKFKSINQEYVRVCDQMSLDLLDKFAHSDGRSARETDKPTGRIVSPERVESYKRLHLTALYDSDAKNIADILQEDEENEKRSGESSARDQLDGDQAANNDVYDIKKNGTRTLMSVLDQLLVKRLTPKSIKSCVQENRVHLMQDLIRSSLMSERAMRPIIETVIENICTKKMKLRLMEVNVDDGLVRNHLCQLLSSIEPQLSLDYSLAHPDIERLQANKLLATTGPQTKTYTLKDLNSLFADKQLNNFDLTVYKDVSCYRLPKPEDTFGDVSAMVSALNGSVKQSGYVMLVLRQRLTLAEGILSALSEPEQFGLDEASAGAWTGESLVKVNGILESRCKLVIDEAERKGMLYLAKKSDANGCTILLFRRTSGQLDGSADQSVNKPEVVAQTTGRVLLRIRHDDTGKINGWLETLKSHFRKPEAPKESTSEEPKRETSTEEQLEAAEPFVESTAQVWLCAVATRDNPISGLIGMMQALKKEVGSSRLRCYYDAYTFKNKPEPVGELDIENCSRFRESLRRDHIWNCIDSSGDFGSYRHFTINEYLSHRESSCGEEEKSSFCISGEEQQLVVGAYCNNAIRGDLSSFTWFEAPFKYLTADERQSLVRVAYSALNFRDIMLATGRLPLDAVPIKLAMADCLLGLEFSGYDADNKRVMGMVYGRGIATHVLCPERSAIKIEVPEGMNLREAATIPVVYATVVMALIYRGRMRRGESILIHAGSGGVGQAAIRLAAHHGLEIYTTVGTEEKRKFLLDEFSYCLDADHIFSSRDCNFEPQILRATRGRGVDLVLNSLADDKLQASVNCLADGGRFLEIGKYDLSVDSRLELLKLDTNKTFHGVLLDKIFETEDIGPAFAHQLKCVMDTLKDGLSKGYIRPIKYTLFKRHQVEEAFRFMATGKHMGKILIEIDGTLEPHGVAAGRVPALERVHMRCVPRFQVAPDKSYIVTGGLGGFGLELTKWLCKQGAKHVVLTSRSGLRSGYQRATLRRLESNDQVKFLVVDHSVADTTTRDGVERLCQLALEMAPAGQLGGVFHLAMVLKDTLLENMSAEDFLSVCRPKIDTCAHLDEVTSRLDHSLDYFVAFSSVTSGKGNAGQSNYAYANSYLERVCEQRRRRGLHGLAIQWGAIGDVGVAFENLGGNNIVIGGTIPQRIPSCMATLGKLLGSPFATCLSVLPVNRSSDGAGEKGDLVGAIMHVLGIKDASKVSESATLGELGLDSLMAVEIRQYIEREYDKTLNIQEIRSLTIAKIREISEMEKPAVVARAAAEGADAPKLDPSTPKMREVASYGTKLSEDNAAGIELPAAGEQLAQLAVKNKQELQRDYLDAVLNKSKVAAFVPKLKLPTRDFKRLNYASSPRSGHKLPNGGGRIELDAHDNRPIFFIPPIHGNFDRLEAVCARVRRPCIGLNWTRKLGRAASVAEAVECYLEVLRSADWQRDFCLASSPSRTPDELVVDLVGYSFGATVAFELMLALGRQQESGAGERKLRAGQLVLLDGSPRQVEFGSHLITDLTRRRPMRVDEKVDELLLVYVMAHTRRLKDVDYLELKRRLAGAEMARKVALASETLVRLIDASTKLDGFAATETNGARQVLAADDDAIDDDEFVTSDAFGPELKRERIAEAMEAFCRRYELVTGYRTGESRLARDATLIRAREVWLTAATGAEQQRASAELDDLELAAVVSGKVHLYVMEGDHETFLNRNSESIGRLISKHCECS